MKSPTGVVSPLSINSSVFEFSEEANNSGYLRTTGKEGIFSPGHMDDNPFKYSPHMQKKLINRDGTSSSNESSEL
jgi:hypothetical protein